MRSITAYKGAERAPATDPVRVLVAKSTQRRRGSESSQAPRARRCAFSAVSDLLMVEQGAVLLQLETGEQRCLEHGAPTGGVRCRSFLRPHEHARRARVARSCAGELATPVRILAGSARRGRFALLLDHRTEASLRRGCFAGPPVQHFPVKRPVRVRLNAAAALDIAARCFRLESAGQDAEMSVRPGYRPQLLGSWGLKRSSEVLCVYAACASVLRLCCLCVYAA